HDGEEGFAGWRAALGRSLAPFAFERVFIAAIGRHAVSTGQTATVRDQAERNRAPVGAEFELAAGFEFGGALLQYLRAHPVDAVLFNYVTNFPVIDALGLGETPVVCEMHDLQAFQRALQSGRPVDAAELDEEFAWLA